MGWRGAQEPQHSLPAPCPGGERSPGCADTAFGSLGAGAGCPEHCWWDNTAGTLLDIPAPRLSSGRQRSQQSAAVVQWHLLELSQLLARYRQALPCLPICHCVLHWWEMP